MDEALSQGLAHRQDESRSGPATSRVQTESMQEGVGQSHLAQKSSQGGCMFEVGLGR